MSKTHKTLLVMEFLVGFTPVIILLGLGLVFALPMGLLKLMLEGGIEVVPMLIMVIGGLFGMVGVVALLLLNLGQKINFISSASMKAFIFVGLVAIAVFAYGIIEVGLSMNYLYFIMPLVVTTHFVVMGWKHINEQC